MALPPGMKQRDIEAMRAAEEKRRRKAERKEASGYAVANRDGADRAEESAARHQLREDIAELMRAQDDGRQPQIPEERAERARKAIRDAMQNRPELRRTQRFAAMVAALAAGLPE